LGRQVELLDLARYASAACGALAVAAAVWLGALLSTVSGGLLAGWSWPRCRCLQALGTAIRVDTISLATLLGAAALVVRWYRSSQSPIALARRRRHRRGDGRELPRALLLGLLGWLYICRWREDPSTAPDDRRASLISRRRRAGDVPRAEPLRRPRLPAFWRWFTFQANVALLRHPHADEPRVGFYMLVLADQGAPAMAACVAAVLAATAPSKPTGALAVYGILQFTAFSLMRSQYERVRSTGDCAPVYRRLRLALLAARPRSGPGCRRPSRCSRHRWSVVGGRRLRTRASRQREFASRLSPGDVRLDRSERARFRDARDRVGHHAAASDDLRPRRRPQPFQAGLQAAFEKAHPSFVKNIVKCQFIAAVYNYDPKLLEPDGVFFLASSQNRDFIAYNRAVLPEPAAFYEALDRRATVAHEGEGMHERLLLYVTGSTPVVDRRGER
jgi:hypothetical protein